MKNAYEIRGRITSIIIKSPKYGRIETFINTNKFGRAHEFPSSWCVAWDPKTKSFYVQGTFMIKGIQKTVKLHRWITNAPKGMLVDHRNHDTLDNTDANLRICTQSENQQNLKGAQINNKSSGIRGVSWHKKNKKWSAQIGIDGKLINLGLFEDLSDAEHTVIEARKKYMPFSKDVA